MLFGDKIENINLEYYPLINDFEVLRDSYWFKQLFSITEINEEHSIEYVFENGISDFIITLNVFITLYEQFNIDKFKKYKFAIILNDTEYIYDETSGLNYNSNNVITINNTVDVLYNLKIIYKLFENIYNENENITNYFLQINFSDFNIKLMTEYMDGEKGFEPSTPWSKTIRSLSDQNRDQNEQKV